MMQRKAANEPEALSAVSEELPAIKLAPWHHYCGPDLPDIKRSDLGNPWHELQPGQAVETVTIPPAFARA